MNCTTEKLIKAAVKLQQLHPLSEITGIQFEDGSGYKVNYQLDGGKWFFKNLLA